MPRFSLIRSVRALAPISRVALALTATLPMSACIDNDMGLGENSSSRVILSNPVGSSSSSFLVLSRVVRSASDPTGSLDLIGDGSGTLGQFCIATSGDSDNPSGPSTCACRYSYTRANGAAEVFEAPTTYHETNLIRCSTSSIPSDVESMKVSVLLTTTNAVSNETNFNLNGSGITLDLSDESSFGQVTRYQCRDAPYVPYLLSANIYDPIRSEDPELSYPLNFYARNLADALARFVTNPLAMPSGSSGWLCPTNPENPDDDNLDYRIFSVQSDGSSKLIYPPTGSVFDRSTFYLARSKSGVFDVPVNGFLAPNTITSDDAPIGYGASPIPRADGSGEDCPDSSVVTIPDDWEWVKVWLFRASLADRKVHSSGPLAGLPIACNPGSWDQNGGDEAVFKACDQAAAGHQGTLAATNDTQMADRVFGTTNPLCATLEGADCSGGATGTTGPGCSVNVPGADFWNMKPDTFGDPDCTTVDPTNPIWLDMCAGNIPQNLEPIDPDPTFVSVDGGVSRFDFLFVVSPAGIMTSDFKNGLPASLPYTPYRFYSKTFCTVNDPDAAASGDCEPNKTIRYGFKFHDVTTNGDAPINEPGRLPAFPICTVRPSS